MNDAWHQTLHILEKSLNPGLFKVWIKPLQAECCDNSITLKAPNAFVASWVKERLMDAVLQAAGEALGEKVHIDIEVAGGSACTAEKKPVQEERLHLPIAAPKLIAAKSWRFSFEDFIVGPCNELAYTAARALSEEPSAVEQLFVTASPGLGKTHLMHAVGQRLALEANKSTLRIACLTAEEFAGRMIMAIKSKEMEKFRAEFREDIDVLLLEDIHFLENKEKIQDELLSTMKALKSRGCRVVMSSSFLPRELKAVDSHLTSRFCSGFLAVMEKPDFETRKRILFSKASAMRVNIHDGVADVLADRLHSDVRQLESCLQSLLLKAKLLKTRIDHKLVEQVLENYTTPDKSPVGIDKIIDYICRNFEISMDELTSKSRKRQIVLARNSAFFLARKHTDLSLKQIGSRFNRRHSTVLKGITNVEREISKQTPLGRRLDATIKRIDTV
jgi:chromosomal replication initiator protein